MANKLPNFEYRQWYETSISSIDDIDKYFFKREISDNNYFRGMNRYEYICISSFYRFFLSNNKNLKWENTEIGFNTKISLPKIDTEEYKNLSYEILDSFEQNLLKLGSQKLTQNTIIYLAQHYGLPTNLIDFTFDPKIALYFACEDAFDSDCVVYMYNIFAHHQRLIEHYSSGRSGYFFVNADGTDKTKEQITQDFLPLLTTIDRKNSSIITPIIKKEEIHYSQRIMNQKGAFVYHAASIPFDQIMYTISSETAYHYRRVFKIDKNLKSRILEILDIRFGINEDFLYPHEGNDPNKNIIEKAVSLTKEKHNIT